LTVVASGGAVHAAVQRLELSLDVGWQHAAQALEAGNISRRLNGSVPRALPRPRGSAGGRRQSPIWRFVVKVVAWGKGLSRTLGGNPGHGDTLSTTAQVLLLPKAVSV